MKMNHAALAALFVSFNAAFRGGLAAVQEPQWSEIATYVPSTTKSNEYGWLGKLPRMREWLGDRVVHGLQSHGYTIRNKPFELTVAVDRDDIDDDNLGIYTPLFTEMGQASATHPDELIYGLLGLGTTELCYDGQPFFDQEHPVIGPDGNTVLQSNYDNNSGSGTPWYIADCSRSLKPLIFQERKKPNMVAKVSETDDNVFDRKEFVYGVDCRRNVGFGLWQQAYGSRKALDATNLQAAITALEDRTGDHGNKLGMKATTLFVPKSLQWKARELINSTRLANGADNIMKDALKIVVPNWLS